MIARLQTDVRINRRDGDGTEREFYIVNDKSLIESRTDMDLKFEREYTSIHPDVFQICPNLTNLYMENLILEQPLDAETFANCIDLKRLVLSNLNITTLHSDLLKPLTQLEYLCLSHNSIQEVPFFHSNLEFVSFCGNNLREINEYAFSKLNGLNTCLLSENEITEVHPRAFSCQSKLIYLDMSRNNIVELHKNTFPRQLQILNLKAALDPNASIASGIFEQNSLLQRIDMSENQLNSVSEDLFKETTDLQEIDLSGNRIEEFELGTFSNLSNLQKIKLNGNPIARMEESHIKETYFANNPNVIINL